MRTFKQHLAEKLQDRNFQEAYAEERELLQLSLKIAETRKDIGLSQKELAEKACVTQQQLSRIEQGMNCNVLTFLKVCHALGITLNISGIAR